MLLRVKLDKPQRVLLLHAIMHLRHVYNNMLLPQTLHNRRVQPHMSVLGVVGGIPTRRLDDTGGGDAFAEEAPEVPGPGAEVDAFVVSAQVDAVEDRARAREVLEHLLCL